MTKCGKRDKIQPIALRLYFFMLMKLDYDSLYFSPADVLECGQIFRYTPYREGYMVYSRDKACYVYASGNKTIVECDDGDYFYRFFDLERDYAAIVQRAKAHGIPLLARSAEACKGLRLLNQNAEETIFSFILSQNNNIPRIKGIISRICEGLGEERRFMGRPFFTFPAAQKLAEKLPEYYRALGAGYRDKFIVQTAVRLAAEGVERLKKLPSSELKKELLTYAGIGPKVADCIALFGFGRTDCFPVDTWIEKIYREDFCGELRGRDRINAYFTRLFGSDSGYMQQYLFYAKRTHL